MIVMETRGVKYIGSKRTLIRYILDVVKHVPIGHMLDPFTGTTRVAQAFRKAGWEVHTSDLAWASEAYANLFLKTTPEELGILRERVDQLNALEGVEDWITQSYCDIIANGGVVRMWKPKNGRKADAIRNKIDEWDLTPHIKQCLIAILILAMDAVDSSVGVQQAYLKDWAIRADNDLILVVPEGIEQGLVGTHIVGDCTAIAWPNATLAYLDPPYSAHSYATYYHIWDSIARWDKPVVGLKTNRRLDRIAGTFDANMKSEWNSKKTALTAFEKLLDHLPVQYILLSYSDESLLKLDQLVPLFTKYKKYEITEVDYKRNIMSRIGNATLNERDRESTNVEYLILIEK